MVKILDSASGTLVLEPDERGWCQVVLDLDGRRLALGADTMPIIVERLRRALLDESSGPVSGSIEGVAVRGVLSLAERHSTLYVSDLSGGRVMFIQAADGSVLAKLPLDAHDVKRWCDELAR